MWFSELLTGDNNKNETDLNLNFVTNFLQLAGVGGAEGRARITLGLWADLRFAHKSQGTPPALQGWREYQ